MKLSCDICGRPDARAVILIEGAKMVACGGCMRNGKVLYRLDDDAEEAVDPRSLPIKKSAMEENEELVDGCGTIVKRARERIGVQLAVIAEKISERESYLDAIENGRMKPTLQVAKKLERELGVKLIEKASDETLSSSDRPSGKFSEPTLGDVIVQAKKKKGK
jgi:putative transcription factor